MRRAELLLGAPASNREKGRMTRRLRRVKGRRCAVAPRQAARPCPRGPVQGQDLSKEISILTHYQRTEWTGRLL